MDRRAWWRAGAAWACAAAVVAALAWEAHSSSPGLPFGALAADVYSDELDGCREVVKRVERGRLSAPEAEDVESDRQYAAQLLDADRNIRGFGVSTCGDVRVVSIGVASYRVSVPAVLPRGTAVVAYYQPPIFLF
ncbi:hypothetical protein D9V41_12555 [Aeromicrobium phragmitis]|uniref:Uncharacterized protein n=1 Tax=Aeromicrobium phragmitis TaxID=2478914 RepID=A0A3L8PKN3_9ACTN|nr:hypothetical protein [Aeromicrobium phragmitis]RLV55148.1 hypothetical protein D9V41_12555 [Aeromicrobium phragmitis]